MELASLIVLGFAVAVTVNTAWASSRRSGSGCLGMLVAIILLAIAATGIAWFGPRDQVKFTIALALPALGVLACAAVAVKAARRDGNPFAAIALALLLGGMGYIIWDDGPSPLDRRSEAMEARIAALDEQKAALERRRAHDIPELRAALRRQAEDIRAQLDAASPANRVLLETELRDLARLEVGLEGEEARISDLIVRIEAQQRGLERSRFAAASLEDYDALDRELDALWIESGVLLDRSLSDRLREDTAGALEVDEAFERLMHDAPRDRERDR